MIVVDTNILVRYAVKDDLKQTNVATEFLRTKHCLILRTVLLELAWVLSSPAGYSLPREIVVARLLHICGLPTVTVEGAVAAKQAIDWYSHGMDFADALHVAASQGYSGFATMDRKLVNRAAKIAKDARVQAL